MLSYKSLALISFSSLLGDSYSTVMKVLLLMLPFMYENVYGSNLSNDMGFEHQELGGTSSATKSSSLSLQFCGWYQVRRGTDNTSSKDHFQ